MRALSHATARAEMGQRPASRPAIDDSFTTGASSTSATVFRCLPSGAATSSCDDLSLTSG